MCAACVAQGVGYVGTALVSLQVMGARAKAKRRRPGAADAVDAVEGSDAEVASETEQPAGV